MKKAIFTLFGFLIMFSFAVTGAMAQDWAWSQPVAITAPPVGSYADIEFYPHYPAISGRVDGDITYEPLFLGASIPSVLRFTDLGISGQGIQSVFAPPVGMEYVIDADTISLSIEPGVYDTLDPQPFIPTTDGEFTSIAAGPDGELYVLFDADNGIQYLLEGTPLIPWDIVSVRFSPRSLNLGSNGGWVTCKISGLPRGYNSADVDMDRVCIVAVNGEFIAETDELICSSDSGGPYNNRNIKKLIVKFDRGDLSDFISEYPGQDPATAAITVAGYSLDGVLQFYGADVIKTKPVKVKKDKSK